MRNIEEVLRLHHECSRSNWGIARMVWSSQKKASINNKAARKRWTKGICFRVNQPHW
ncbi:hypothetical protein [Thiobacillus sp. 65-1402]|uniref:hypothetical protein n=1 Tax=Thiobacillus sp. 65-1402 TaxID=1895861 RepID=UPI0025F21551|nr:hypothetical protein [Thiobacillus sp. 65-1402]